MVKNNTLKKIWYFLWESNSLLSWIADLILAFIIVKFIFFPLLSLIFASSLPMVVVESTSMLHETNFDQFWQQYGSFYEKIGITKESFINFPLKNGFDKGDIMIIQGKKDYEVGDVIVFRIHQQPTPIIHRIINKTNDTYSTKGDHNPYQLSYEKEIKKEQVVGKAIARIPWLGWIKLIFVDFFKMF
ncbi:MAG: signal peptidase I [Candidatus Pacearchaeota archaeon]